MRTRGADACLENVMGNCMRQTFIFFGLFIQQTFFGQVQTSFANKAGETICLRHNGTYIFIGDGHMVNVVDTGTYKIYHDTLTLNSFVQPTDIVNIRFDNETTSDSTRVSFKTVSSEVPRQTFLVINDSIEYPINSATDNFRFRRGFIKTIQLKSMHLQYGQDKKYSVDNTHNRIEIVLDDRKGFRRAFFTNEKYLYNETSIISVADKNYLFIVQQNLICK
jgi:hypothetical protein